MIITTIGLTNSNNQRPNTKRCQLLQYSNQKMNLTSSRDLLTTSSSSKLIRRKSNNLRKDRLSQRVKQNLTTLTCRVMKKTPRLTQLLIRKLMLKTRQLRIVGQDILVPWALKLWPSNQLLTFSYQELEPLVSKLQRTLYQQVAKHSLSTITNR